ncbi:type II secretion system F family protein [Staphylococcus chromogenes]|nr:type II secretion system F family protein [Staphylococcus chromogenes]
MIALFFLAGGLLAWPASRSGHRLAEAATAPVRPRDGPVTALAIAADIDLFAACIESGLSTAQAAACVAKLADQANEPAWQSIAALLAIGVDARAAWAPAEEIEGLREIARAAQASTHTGAALAMTCKRTAESLRSDARDAAVAAAERAGVLIAMPLTLCFLPAFFILGLAPIVINLASTMLAH